MFKSLVLTMITLVFVAGCSAIKPLQPDIESPLLNFVNHDAPRAQIPLSGNWDFLPLEKNHAIKSETPNSDAPWQTISVPLNWYLAGFEHINQAWYKKNFGTFSHNHNERIWLRFEGVDYFATIWLNGKKVGRHEGYFQPFELDITDQLNAHHNELLVLVESPLESPEAWSLNKRHIKGVLSHHDTRPGGAWSVRGQEKNSGGIWANVYLEKRVIGAIKHVDFDPAVGADTTSAVVHIRREQPINCDNEFIRISLKPFNNGHQSETYDSETYDYVLEHCTAETSFQLPEKNRKPWWPHGHGDPFLYTITVQLHQNDGTIKDQYQFNSGFRTVARTERGEWLINGKRLFLKGTNYIPAQWLSEMSQARYQKDIDLMKSANINAVRVHAHIVGKDFYSLADATGILVWQDFPLQWGYEDTESFVNNASKQAVEMIEHLQHHPSIFAWCAHNEPPWDAWWMKYKYPHYNPKQNKSLDETLVQVLSTTDPTRYSHLSSATAEHPWLGWYSGHFKDYAKPTQETLITEFGAQALPDREVLTRFIKDLPHRTDRIDWTLFDYHNFQRKQLTEIAKVPLGETVDQLILNTQNYQAKLTQFAAEAYRRQRYEPVGGIFQFMFVENWPSMNWGVLDYWRNPKPGYFAMKRAFQPVLPSIEWQKDQYKSGDLGVIKIWSINDSWESLEHVKLGATLSHTNSAGKTILDETRQYHFNQTADSKRLIREWSLSDLKPGHYELQAVIQSKDGEILGENSFQFDISHASREIEIKNATL